MNNNELGSIVKNLQQNNMQRAMDYTTTHYRDPIPDSRLAGYFYDFLIGKSNKLPNYEFLSKFVSRDADDIDSISIGYGVLITKNLLITIYTPVSETTTRVDKISENSYKAYKANNITSVDLDVNKSPLFSVQRVKLLQKYLQNYNNFILNNEEQKKTL